MTFTLAIQVTPLNQTLRIIIAMMGIVFFIGALAIREFLWGLGVLAFFAVAFASLTFSGLDPSVKSHEAKRWFIAMIVAGVVAGLVLFVSGVIKLHEGNTSDGLKLLGAFGWLLYVWHKKWHGIKAIIYHQSGKPSPRQSS